MLKNIEPIKILKNHLNDKIRINHCISTADFMKKHATHFNIDQDSAYISGLLHDLAKEMPIEKILALTASPGTDQEVIDEVTKNLHIEAIE